MTTLTDSGHNVANFWPTLFEAGVSTLAERLAKTLGLRVDTPVFGCVCVSKVWSGSSPSLAKTGNDSEARQHLADSGPDLVSRGSS